MLPTSRTWLGHDKNDIPISDEETNSYFASQSTSATRMSAAGMPASYPASAPASYAGTSAERPANETHDSHRMHSLPPIPQSKLEDSSTSTARDAGAAVQLASDVGSDNGGTISASQDVETTSSSNAGLSMGTPLPPHPRSSPVLHAQPTHAPKQSTAAGFVMQGVNESDSPSSVTSSGPSAPPPPPALPSHLPQQPTDREQLPSPPLPSPPPPARQTLKTQNQALSRSNTGTSTAPTSGQNFILYSPPIRSPNAGNGNSGNGYSGLQRNRPTMSSIATSMEKAAVLFDPDLPVMTPPSRVSDFSTTRDRESYSRYHDSGITMPAPVPISGYIPESTNTVDMAQRSRVGIGNGGGAGGGGGGDGSRFLSAAKLDDEDATSMPQHPRTVEERLKPTIDHATAEEAKYARKAKYTGFALNTAIGLQVFLSALITALSAVTSGKRTQVMTSVLGGTGTVVASYLARARGSNEPELSIARVKDLQRFIRACDAFVQDHGRETGYELVGHGEEGKEGTRDMKKARVLDETIWRLREELEHLLGNGDGERRLAPPV